jgi:hypothetical protein
MRKTSEERCDRLLDCFNLYHFLNGEQIAVLLGLDPEKDRRTVNWFMGTHLALDKGERTYAPEDSFVRRINIGMGVHHVFCLPRFKNKGASTLTHDVAGSWKMIYAKLQAEAAGFEVIALSREKEEIQFHTALGKYIPDFFIGLKRGAVSNFYFFEITKSRPGTHAGTKDVVDKCQKYNAFYDEGQFPDWLRRSFGLQGANFRVVFTFPTDARARNFTLTLLREVGHNRRFFGAEEEALHKDVYGSVLYSPKDFPALHSIAKHF